MKVTELLDLRGVTTLVTRDRVEDLTKLYDVLLFYNWQPPVRNPMTDEKATKTSNSMDLGIWLGRCTQYDEHFVWG